MFDDSEESCAFTVQKCVLQKFIRLNVNAAIYVLLSIFHNQLCSWNQQQLNQSYKVNVNGGVKKQQILLLGGNVKRWME